MKFNIDVRGSHIQHRYVISIESFYRFHNILTATPAN